LILNIDRKTCLEFLAVEERIFPKPPAIVHRYFFGAFIAAEIKQLRAKGTGPHKVLAVGAEVHPVTINGFVLSSPNYID